MDTGTLQTNYMIRIGFLMLLVTLLSVACTIVVGFLSARTAAGMARDLRKNVFKKVESFSSTEFDKFSTASLITRSTNDVTQIQMVVIMMMRMVIYAPIIGVGGVIRALAKSTSMWWIIALAVIVLLGLIMTVFSISLPKFKSHPGPDRPAQPGDTRKLVWHDGHPGLQHAEVRGETLRQGQHGPDQCQPVRQPHHGGDDAGNDVDHEWREPVLIIWVGATRWLNRQMQVGDMMAFMQYAMQIVFAFLMLSMMFIILPQSLGIG